MMKCAAVIMESMCSQTDCGASAVTGSDTAHEVPTTPSCPNRNAAN